MVFYSQICLMVHTVLTVEVPLLFISPKTKPKNKNNGLNSIHGGDEKKKKNNLRDIMLDQ